MANAENETENEPENEEEEEDEEEEEEAPEFTASEAIEICESIAKKLKNTTEKCTS
ncbi:MAG: hypothetical protein QXP59_06580 [Saccharolobus sp.]